MAKKDRVKGKVGEREIANFFKNAGFDARRGVQFQGGPDSPDVVIDCELDIHIEVKRVEKFGGYHVEQALSQAHGDAGKGELPIVIHRKSAGKAAESEGLPPDMAGHWLVFMRADTFLKLFKMADKLKKIEGKIPESELIDKSDW